MTHYFTVRQRVLIEGRTFVASGGYRAHSIEEAMDELHRKIYALGGIPVGCPCSTRRTPLTENVTRHTATMQPDQPFPTVMG